MLEIILCEQTTKFFEKKNNLIPENQHGFQAKRSTMSAWAEIQQDWASNIDEKKITGLLPWDLSAAFDTLDAELLCKKYNLLHTIQFIYVFPNFITKAIVLKILDE